MGESISGGPAKWAQHLVTETLAAFSGREKTAFAVVILLSVLASWGLTRAMHVPAVPKYSPSVLSQASPAVAVLAAVAVVAVCAAVGTVIAGRAHYDAGILAAGIGLTTLSIRSGPMGAALRGAQGPAIYVALAAEVLMLWGLLLLAWAVL